MKRGIDFWFSMLILFFTVVVSVIAFVNWVELLFFVDIYFIHWIGIAATTFIAFFIPIYYILKRTKPRKIKTLLKIHVFGNLLAFLLVSVHFSQNLGRLAGFYPRLSDGFILVLIMTVIVTTGVIERFARKPKLVKYTKPIHRYSVFVFYLVILVHALQGFNII
jgi:hypothetical protein